MTDVLRKCAWSGCHYVWMDEHDRYCPKHSGYMDYCNTHYAMYDQIIGRMRSFDATDSAGDISQKSDRRELCVISDDQPA